MGNGNDGGAITEETPTEVVTATAAAAAMGDDDDTSGTTTAVASKNSSSSSSSSSGAAVDESTKVETATGISREAIDMSKTTTTTTQENKVSSATSSRQSEAANSASATNATAAAAATTTEESARSDSKTTTAADAKTRAAAVATVAPSPGGVAAAAAAAAMMKKQNENDDDDDEDTEDEVQQHRHHYQTSVTLYLGKDTFTIPALSASCFNGLEVLPPRSRCKPRLVTAAHPTRKKSVMSPFSEPGTNRSSPWWIPFSVINKTLDVNKDVSPLDGPYCNLCGKELKFGKEQSSSRLKRHIDRRHREAFETLNPIFSKMGSAISNSLINMTAAAVSASSNNKSSAAAYFANSSSNSEAFSIENSVTLILGTNRYTIPALPFSFFKEMEAYPAASSSTRLVTKPHPKVQYIVMSPFSNDNKRTSPWWILFSVANRQLEVNKDVPPYAAQFCNFCAKQMHLGKDLSPSKLKMHIQSHHPEAFEVLDAIFSSNKKIESLSPRPLPRNISCSNTASSTTAAAGLYDLSADEIRALLEKEKKEVQKLEEKLRNKEKDDLIRALNETRQRKESIKRKLESGNNDSSSSSSAAEAPPASTTKKRRPPSPPSTTTQPVAVAATTTATTKPAAVRPPSPQKTAEQLQEESRTLARQTAAGFKHQLQQQQELEDKPQPQQGGGGSTQYDDQEYDL